MNTTETQSGSSLDPLVLRLAELARRPHHTCEGDSWYSCPKAPEGCADDNAGEDCNCGADQINAEVDAIMLYLSQNTSVTCRHPQGGG